MVVDGDGIRKALMVFFYLITKSKKSRIPNAYISAFWVDEKSDVDLCIKDFGYTDSTEMEKCRD